MPRTSYCTFSSAATNTKKPPESKGSNPLVWIAWFRAAAECSGSLTRKMFLKPFCSIFARPGFELSHPFFTHWYVKSRIF